MIPKMIPEMVPKIGPKYPHKRKARAIYLQIKEWGGLRPPQLDLSINVPALFICGDIWGLFLVPFLV